MTIIQYSKYIGIQIFEYQNLKGKSLYQQFSDKPGAEVLGGKNPTSQGKTWLTECGEGHQAVRCPNRVFCVHQPSPVVCGGSVLVVAGCVSLCRWWWYDVLGDGRWGNAVGCEMLCYIMWCHVRCCDVVSCHVMWWELWLDRIRCDKIR